MLKSGYFSGGELGSTRKGKISAQINQWRVVGLLGIVCSNLSGKNRKTTC